MNPQDKLLQDTVALARDFEAGQNPQQLRAAMLALQGVVLEQAATTPARLALRRDVLVRWLGLLQILERARDPAWRLEQVPTLGVEAPRAADGSQQPTGSDPAALARSRRQAEHYQRQLQLQQLQAPMAERAEGFVRSAYGFAPADREEARSLIVRAGLVSTLERVLLQACYCLD